MEINLHHKLLYTLTINHEGIYFFQSLNDEHEDFLAQELWIKENFKEWKQTKEDETRVKMAQSGRYKQYRRYMKNHGTDRMTFDDS